MCPPSVQWLHMERKTIKISKATYKRLMLLKASVMEVNHVHDSFDTIINDLIDIAESQA